MLASSMSNQTHVLPCNLSRITSSIMTQNQSHFPVITRLSHSSSLTAKFLIVRDSSSVYDLVEYADPFSFLVTGSETSRTSWRGKQLVVTRQTQEATMTIL